MSFLCGNGCLVNPDRGQARVSRSYCPLVFSQIAWPMLLVMSMFFDLRT